MASAKRNVKWLDIRNILMRNGFFMDDKGTNQLRFVQILNKEQLTWEDFKNELCQAYDNKEDTKFILYKLLYNNLNYGLEKRHQFYHILLSNYLQFTDLNYQNVADILTNITLKYDENVEKHDIERIVENKNVNGTKLQQLINEQNCNELASTFSILLLDKNDWKNVHNLLITILIQQESTKFDETLGKKKRLDWTKVAETLERNLFFPFPDKYKQKNKLIKLFKKYFADRSVDWKRFKNELCAAYYNQDDKPFIFYNILANELKYSLDKRHQFYHILMHQFLKLTVLNLKNTIQ
eukprot:169562_1